MSLGFKAQEITVRELFSETDSLLMPPYQRGYSWTEKEALELVADLQDAMERGRPYFLGAIVVVQNSPKDPVEVVDGQQRLATLSILFAILRDLSPIRDEANRLHDMLEAKGSLMRPSYWRLTLNNVDTPIFREVIQKRGATPEAEQYITSSATPQHILSNTQAMREMLTEMSDKERSNLSNYILRRCGLVRVKVEDRDMGYTVFRVLNTRGKQPSANDILKSELFELAGFSLDEAATHSIAWNKFGRRLNATGFDELLKFIWTLHGKPGDDILSGYRDHIVPEMSARVFLEDMLPRYVDAFELILGLRQPGQGFPQQAWNHMLHLRSLEHSSWRIPVLRYMISGDLSPDVLTKFFREMERVAFAMQLTRPDGNFRLRRYNRISNAIENGDDLFAEDSDLILKPEEKKMLSERLEGRFATYRQRRSLSLRINSIINDGVATPPDWDATLEHILPRNMPAKSNWTKMWPSTNQHRELVDSIGNFTLLNNAENQEADRQDFEAKKKLFFKNGDPSFALSRDIQNITEWTPETVRERGRRLADLLRAEWEL